MKLRRYLILFNLTLTTLICWSGYGVYETFSLDKKGEPLTPKTGKPQAAGETQAGRSRGLAYYQSIISQDILGTTVALKHPAERIETPKVEEVPVSRRSLYLKGTVVGRDSNSFAVISEGQNVEGDVFRVNDQIHNARVLQILKDRVILESEGKQEALILTYELQPDEKVEPSAAGAQKPPARAPRSIPARARRFPDRK